MSKYAKVAYEFAAEFKGVPTKGSTPTVVYASKPWKIKGGTGIGLYRNYRLPIVKWVIWDRIWVVEADKYPYNEWSNTVHEMTHALEARLGEKKGEVNARLAAKAAREAGAPF